MLLLAIVCLLPNAAYAWRLARPWTEQHWCPSAVEPEWPFAYQKYAAQTWERKGRSNPDKQDDRHSCAVFGVESKCHRCEAVDCEGGVTCEYQLQGVDVSAISANVPTASDSPWAVGGAHRYDFGGASGVCVMLSGGECTNPLATDLTGCAARCWGNGEGAAEPQEHLEALSYVQGADNVDTHRTIDGDSLLGTDSWEYAKRATAQGAVTTVAGSGKGFADGLAAKFNEPSAVAVDTDMNLYVADSMNHAVRVIDASTGAVTTLAGADGKAEEGDVDGPAADSRFSGPRGIALTYEPIANWGDPSSLVLFVADTGNHRIRKITKAGLGRSQALVECFAGRCGNGTDTFDQTKKPASPEPGFADGKGRWARFNGPRGLAIHAATGDLVVADTNNHLIRLVNATGHVFTLAGHLERAEDGTPGCPPPCLNGVMGVRDGNASFAEFQYPKAVAIDEAMAGSTGYYTILVSDGLRVRRVVPAAGFSHSRYVFEGGLTTIGGNVVTVAGTLEAGGRDGPGDEATFQRPAGLVAGADGRVYVADASSCRIRRVDPPRLSAADIQLTFAQGSATGACEARLVDLVRPDGCDLYDAPVGDRDLKLTARFGHVHYNFADRFTKHNNLWAEDDGEESYGRSMKNCVGSPPPDRLDKKAWATGENLAIDDAVFDRDEDTGRGTTLQFKCPASCLTVTGVAEAGGLYSDESRVCAAAIDAGALTLGVEGYIRVEIVHGAQTTFTASDFDASLASVVGATHAAGGAHLVERLFTVTALPETGPFQVQTIAGRPAAPLSDPCGYVDGYPPLSAAFQEPLGLAMYLNETIFVADAGNHMIRALTAATCSQPCENGGECVAPETCECQDGWTGVDCSSPVCSSAAMLTTGAVLCSSVLKSVCVGPETCACSPGWFGAACTTALCVQTCEHGGGCSAPDTCSCAPGWHDSNCTTPVCTQTCGNGGNCTGADTCTCPTEWRGEDCREPVCSQTCQNGGRCVAPDTCQCPPQWQSFDCGLPVCMQGFFAPWDKRLQLHDTVAEDGSPSYFEPDDATATTLEHHHWWPTYTPCDLEDWCNRTAEFDCAQPAKTWTPIEVPSGGSNRRNTGRRSRPTACDLVEVREDALTYFRYARADNSTTVAARYTPLKPFQWDAQGHPWRAFSGPTDGRTSPWNLASDRQPAYFQWLNVSQGRYVCANGGSCVTPEVCKCAEGWSGFDCRTPVCTQGYWKPEQPSFVSGTEDPMEVKYFDRFMESSMADFRREWEYSNPDFVLIEESYADFDVLTRTTVTHPGVRYEEQGGYRCSIRAYTQWEGPNVTLDHPNFYSRYMDAETQADNVPYTEWANMSWPPTHSKTAKLELRHDLGDAGEVTYVYTNEGHKRDGVWLATGEAWTEGTCITEFKRVCGAPDDADRFFPDDLLNDDLDLPEGDPDALGLFEKFGGWQPTTGENRTSEDEKTLAFIVLNSQRLARGAVQDTDFAYRPRVSYDEFQAYGHGRWRADDAGECIDHVLRGCFNNGTCVAPDTCECAKGWAGFDCSVPVCAQTCQHRGNCTMPNECTCDRGWTGSDCSIPLCAQECHHGGKCVAPDTCKCSQWGSEWTTGHAIPRPVFRKPNNEPQRTGWTGFDCTVPICVQAETFRLNVGPAAELRRIMQDSVLVSVGATNFESLGYRELGGRGYDGREDFIDDVTGLKRLKCDEKPRCPSYDNMLVANVGESFPKACGYDVLDTGCCRREWDASTLDSIVKAIIQDPTEAYKDTGTYACYQCADDDRYMQDDNFTCSSASMTGDASTALDVERFVYEDVPERFFHGRLPTREVRICGITKKHMNFEEVLTLRPEYSSSAADTINLTSHQFLCGVTQWIQGDYAGLLPLTNGIGIDYGPGEALERFEEGRHIRVNTPNFLRTPGVGGEDDIWNYGPTVRGEGIYECAHEGTCISPDVCTCKDGWSGYDCRTSLCRHLQSPTNTVASCENGGVCKSRDDCKCIQTPSVLKKKYPEAVGGLTGWAGTDCSMPICAQGYFDPFCADLPQAPGGEGCYRCANGGNCTAPDACSCAEGWQGYDCRTPRCEVVASPRQRRQLDTDDEEKIDLFERNPCSLLGLRSLQPWPRGYSGEGSGGYLAVPGNCTAPNECTCWCKATYDKNQCERRLMQNTLPPSYSCRGPYQDMLGSPLTTRLDLVNYRNLLETIEAFGTRSCRIGWEGTVDEEHDRFTTCHMRIFQPTSWEANTLTIIIGSFVFTFVGLLLYVFLRRKIKEKYRLAKIERRRISRRNSDNNIGDNPKTNSASTRETAPFLKAI